MLKINSNYIQYNYQEIKKRIGNKSILAVIKSNAYNIGLIPVAKILSEKCKCNNFVVSNIEEGKILRKAGFYREKILILRPLTLIEKDIKDVLKYQLIPTIQDINVAVGLNNIAYKDNSVCAIHLNVDTGMGRFGVLFDQFIPFYKEIKNCKNLFIESIYSHFSSASSLDKDSIEYTKKQLYRYQKIVNEIGKYGVFLKHIANSAGILVYPESYFDAVRPGILLYGILPQIQLDVFQNNFKEAIHWTSSIISIRKIKKGNFIGYDRKYKVKQDKLIGVIPIGYVNGYSNIGYVMKQKDKIPIIGKVGMDSLMLDLSNSMKTDIKLNDEVTILGGNKISILDASKKTGQIPHILLTNIRDKKEYIYI